MKRLVLTAAMLVPLLAPAACDKGKPRHVPVDDMAIVPPMDGLVAAPTEGLTASLTRRPGVPGFSLDRIGQAPDPLNRRPAVTPADQAIVFAGFAFDPVAKAPAKGVDLVVDNKVYGTAYGAARTDVAAYFKAEALTKVGYAATLAAGTLAPGEHTAVARVVAADGKAYFQSPSYPFTVK